MFLFKKRSIFAILSALCLFAFSGLAAEIEVPVDGFRSSPVSAGVIANGSWNGAFKVNWKIQQDGANYHYIYTITNNSDEPLKTPIRHLLLEVNPTLSPTNYAEMLKLNRGSILESPELYSKSGDNRGLPSELYAIKFELEETSDGVAVLEFYSNRPPVWGDFYAQGKGNRYAYNTGLESEFGTESENNGAGLSVWLPVPTTGNIEVAVPEPQTYIILGTALFIAFLAKRRREAVKADQK